MANKRPTAKTPAAQDRRTSAARLMAIGKTNPQISAIMKCHETTISAWRSDPFVRSTVDRLTAASLEDARLILSGGAVDAATALLEKARDGSSKGDARAAKDVLAIAGLSAVQKVEATVTATPLPDERVIPELIAALTALVTALDPTERAALRPDVDALRGLL